MAKNKELNELIKRIKYQYDLNQGEIASKIGVKDTYLSDVLNGRADFNDTLRTKIYEVFSDVQAELSSQRYAGGGEQTNVHGNNINGNNVTVNQPDTMDKLLEMLAMKEASLVKAQEHIDKLLEIIGNITKGNNNG